MLINNNPDNETHVKFIGYTGKYPNLCTGVLTLEIDGKETRFGNKELCKEADYPRFWRTGGSMYYTGTFKGEWVIDVAQIPEQFRKYASEIDRVFNDNVERGCCGGCR